MSYRTLRERLERATGPDRGLDREIWDILIDHLFKDEEPPTTFEEAPMVGQPTNFTDSLDASIDVVACMLPGWCWQVANKPEPWASIADVRPPDSVSPWQFVGEAATPTLSLLVALLSVLADKEAA